MTSRRRRTTMSDVYDTHLQGIVCISGTSRPDNYTARALDIVVDELHHSRVAPVVFDARALQLAFPGHPDPGDGERLRTAIAAAPGVILATPEYHIPPDFVVNRSSHRVRATHPLVFRGFP